MKLTNKQLKEIIKEELGYVLEEQPLDEGSRGLENLRQHLIKLFRDHAHMFNDIEDMRGFINDVANESVRMLSNQTFGPAGGMPMRGSVVVDDPMMQ
tara:strand:- start:275 stop:565 length:291 start_codon:yes stop_codon:yes gene_type:complete